MNKILTFLTAITFSAIVWASPASDDASNYTSWTDGSNEGTGFAAWSFLTGGGISGHVLESASNQGTNSATMDTANQSFGIYADPGTSADAFRGLSSSLNIGEILSFSISYSFDGGSKGFNLRNGGTGVFNFNIGGGNYNWEGGNSATIEDSSFTGARPEGIVIDASFTRTSTGVDYAFTSSHDSNIDNSTGSVALSGIDEIQFYVANAGGGPDGNLYFNSLAVIPEPGVALLFLGGLGFLALWRRRIGARM